jgi:hypothetical protein
VKSLLKKINGRLALFAEEIKMGTILVILCQKKGRMDLMPFAFGIGLGIDFAILSALLSTL